MKIKPRYDITPDIKVKRNYNKLIQDKNYIGEIELEISKIPDFPKFLHENFGKTRKYENSSKII